MFRLRSTTSLKPATSYGRPTSVFGLSLFRFAFLVVVTSGLLIGGAYTISTRFAGLVTATAVTLTSSTGNWIVPDGVTEITVEVWGGGGAGGGAGGNPATGGGGAGGAYARKVMTVTPGTNYSYAVGAVKTTTATTTQANNLGNPSWFDTVSTVYAPGGQGGAPAASNSTNGANGVGSSTGAIGDTVYAGGSGSTGVFTASTGYSGAGGGGAGSTGAGGAASTSTGGTGTSDNGGNGGNGVGDNTAGIAGSSYGGGGSGGKANTTTDRAGGSGAAGLIRITYNSTPSFSVTPTDSPDPVTDGNNVTFSATATDAESDSWKLVVCKTNNVTPGTNPTCASGESLCVSSSAVGSGVQNTCTWTSSGDKTQSWFAFACDNNATSPRCSSADTTNSPVTVQGASVEQEGFRFRNDDGDEDAANWLAAQDSGVTRPLDQIIRLRTLINSSTDPYAQDFKLEYKKSTDGSYTPVPTDNDLGTTPVVESVATGTSPTTDAALHNINMPTGIVQGDLLLIVFTSDGAPGPSAGQANFDISEEWAKLTPAQNGSNVSGAIYYKFAEGSGSDYAIVNTVTVEQGSYVVYRISGGGIPVATSASATLGANSDPPNLDTGVTKNYLWIATRGGDAQVVATAAPSGYSSLQSVAGAGASGASTNTAIKASTASSENPGTFTSTAEDWVAFTIAVPSVSAGVKSMSAAGIGTTSISLTYPDGIEEGDLLLLPMMNKEGGTAAPTTPSGWDTISNYQATGGSGAAGLDAGSVVTTLYTKEADGTETGSFSITVTSGNVSIGRIVVVKKLPGTTWDLAAVNGSDTTINTTWSVTGGSDPGIEGGDMVFVATGVNTDAYGYASHSFTATGVTFGPTQEIFEVPTNTGNDAELVMTMHPAYSGTSSAAPNLTMTANSSGTNNPAGTSIFLRVRQLDPPIHIVNSTHIGTSGEATTAQLTPPSGKTTANFEAGRIQDDQNPADSVDIGSNEYTELEWALQANSPAVNGDIYQFRVTKNGDVLNTYTVTPQWTIGTANDLPTLSIAQPDGTGDTVDYDSSYTITYTLADPDNTTTAAFYYDTDNTGLNGVALTGACATAAEGTGATCLWDFSGVAAGSYYIYGIADDGVNAPVSAYSSGQLTINSGATPELEQEGFRFRNDDGDEDAATWLAAQDTNITRATNLNTRLRMLINSTDDVTSEQYQLEYKEAGDVGYTPVGLGGDTSPTPVVESVSTGQNTTAGTAHTITMPSGITAGDLLVIIFSSDGGPGSNSDTGAIRLEGGNWVRLAKRNSGTVVSGAVFYKIAEGSDTASVTTNTAEESSHVVYRISGASIPHVASSDSAGANSANTDPPSLDAIYSRNYLWIAARSGDDQVVATVAPSGYSNLQTVTATNTTGASTNTAVYSSTSDTENPGTFTSSSEAWVAFTIGISPSNMGVAAFGVRDNGTDVIDVPYPASIESGDLLVTMVSYREATGSSISITSGGTGWSSEGRVSGGSGSGVDAGSMYAEIFTKVADGTETGTIEMTVSPSASTTNSTLAHMLLVKKETGTTWDTAGIATFGGGDNSGGTSWSVTAGSDPGIEEGDLILAVSAINTDGNEYLDHAITTTGVTYGWNQELSEFGTGSGNDSTISISAHRATAGTSSGNPTFTMTSSDSATSDEPAGATAMIRIRADGAGSSEPIILSDSTHVTASGVATTAQLTAPSGKTTSDFTAGRLQDDENPTDAVDIAVDDYTELEWSLTATDLATNGDVYSFRVTKNGVVLDTYTVTPQWTIGSAATPTFSLAAYRWYVDNDSENVSDPWGTPDLAANAQIGLVPALLNSPPITSTELRLRVGITVNTNALSATSQQFKLQYKAGTDASCTSGSWTDIAAGGAGGIWRFATSGVTDGTTLTTLKLTSTSDVLQVYAKANPTTTNPNSATAGQDIEYDFHIQHNGAGNATTYSFRVVESDDTVFDAYTVCPTLITAPGTEQIMRHGEVFAEESERGKTWAN